MCIYTAIRGSSFEVLLLLRVWSFVLVAVVGLLQEAAKATQSSNLGCSEGLMFHDVPHPRITTFLFGTCFEHCNRNVSSLIVCLCNLTAPAMQLSYLGLAPQMPCRTWSFGVSNESFTGAQSAYNVLKTCSWSPKLGSLTWRFWGQWIRDDFGWYRTIKQWPCLWQWQHRNASDGWHGYWAEFVFGCVMMSSCVLGTYGFYLGFGDHCCRCFFVCNKNQHSTSESLSPTFKIPRSQDYSDVAWSRINRREKEERMAAVHHCHNFTYWRNGSLPRTTSLTDEFGVEDQTSVW